MMGFDMEGRLRGARSALEFMQSMGEPEAGKPIGNYGVFEIPGIIKCVIFGLAGQAMPFASRANRWIDQGMASKEYEWFGASPAQHGHDLHNARALGAWLEENRLATDHWNEARRFLEAWWMGGAWSPQHIRRYGLDVYMGLAVLGGRSDPSQHGLESFHAGIAMFEQTFTSRKVSFKKTLKPRELGYALCRHYLNGEFDRDEILQAGRRMLAANLTDDKKDGWLENGQSDRAAMWLMLIYWYPAFHNGETLPSPVDVLLKAYDDMPDVTRPF